LSKKIRSYLTATSEFPEIRQTPAPLWELAELKRYATMAIQYSRGCPFDCEFCNITALFGHRPRAQAGFNMVFIGVETPDDDSLAECNKKQNRRRDLVKDIKRIQRSGMQVQGGFIIGFDNDPPSIFQKQIEFIQKSDIVTAMVGLLQAPIGTRLYERLKREGRLLGAFSGDNVDGTTNIISKMSLDVLHKGYKTVVQFLYAPKNYYARVKTFLKEYKAPKIKIEFDFEYVLAFFRSIIQLGIIDKERIHYWKLFFWTLFRRPGCSR
jgi:radical SAM superfamily enzyme YgiQ (UPF0313 family)